MMDKVGEVEKKFKCSGICSQQSIYYFSDVNMGAPEKRCLEALSGEVLFDSTGKYGAAFLIIWFFLLLGWCAHWGVYRCKK